MSRISFSASFTEAHSLAHNTQLEIAAASRRLAIRLVLMLAVWASFGAFPAKAITVPGMGHYCSGTWANGGWAFTSLSNGGDPCASILRTGGTVKRKGLYANNNWNRVVYRCYPPGYGFVGIYEGWGNGPLSAAFDAAKKDNKPGCIFNVSPTAIPIFDSPFPLNISYSHSNGFDFARGRTLDVHEFGQSGSTAATIVDWKGRERSYGDDHAGHDWNMPRGTPIRAVASGVVVSARIYDSGPCTNFPNGCTCSSDTRYQREVSIRHTVMGTSASYAEQFLSYYAHLQSYSVSEGQVVSKGDVIGFSGNTGCSYLARTGAHLPRVLRERLCNEHAADERGVPQRYASCLLPF